MKTNHLTRLLAAALLGIFTAQLPAFADDEDSSTDFGTRYSAGIDKKIIKGLHVNFEEELRLDGLSSLDKSFTSLGLSYKICPYLKVGVGYSAIAARREDDLNPGSKTWDWRHRGTFDLTGMYRTGGWKFSLRERFQATCKTRSVNLWEQPQTALALKSRIKVSYLFYKSGLEPYASFEHRLLLNGAEWDSRSTDIYEYTNSSYIGHSDVYTNRLRGELGLKWEISKKNAVEIYWLYDDITDKEIDAKKSKPILKEPVCKTGSSYTAIGIGYTFSF
ncbi:MAG: DUF2490 domain-containing protein [Candidatus Cryptobacteroides sp.]